MNEQILKNELVSIADENLKNQIKIAYQWANYQIDNSSNPIGNNVGIALKALILCVEQLDRKIENKKHNYDDTLKMCQSVMKRNKYSLAKYARVSSSVMKICLYGVNELNKKVTNQPDLFHTYLNKLEDNTDKISETDLSLVAKSQLSLFSSILRAMDTKYSYMLAVHSSCSQKMNP